MPHLRLKRLLCNLLQVQVSRFRVDGERQGRAGPTGEAVHSPGLARHWGAMDETDHIIPKAETDQQQFGSTWICEFLVTLMHTSPASYQPNSLMVKNSKLVIALNDLKTFTL